MYGKIDSSFWDLVTQTVRENEIELYNLFNVNLELSGGKYIINY